MMFSLMEKIAYWSLRLSGTRSVYHHTSVGRVHAYDKPCSGKLPPFVFLHGLASSALGYANLSAMLCKHSRRIISVDLPGHGRSAYPVGTFSPETIFKGVCETLDDMLPEPVFLFGNSLGGALALRYAIQNPQQIRGLILASPAGAPMTLDEFRNLRQLFALTSPQEAASFLDLLYFQPPWYRKIVELWLLRLISRPHIQSFIEYFAEQSNRSQYFFSPTELQNLKCPILLMWGGSEQLLPQSGLEFFRTNLPKHTIIECPEHFAHSPQIEFPKQVAQRIKLFAEEPTSSPHTAISN
jgi:pimeloyl-ACP methyl ester carboxylesterase